MSVCSGQPMVENGHMPEENQVSSTSGSWVQPSPGGSSSGPTQRISPSGPYQTGIRWPHHSCREMHQSCMLSTQSKYLGGQLRRVDLRPTVADRVAGRLGQRFHLHEPLGGQPRFDHVVGPRAVPDGVDVRDLLGDDAALLAQFLP